MSQVKAIFFDLDGTLVEAQDWHFNALNYALWEVARTKISRYEHLTTFNGLPTRAKLDKLIFESRLHPLQVKDVYNLKQNMTISHIRNHCVPDTVKVKMCRLLSVDYELWCVSNAIEVSVRLMLWMSGLTDFFKDIIHNQEIDNPKPAPDAYNLALERSGFSTEEVVAVEDNIKGVVSAKAANIRCIHLQYPEITYERIRNELCLL